MRSTRPWPSWSTGFLRFGGQYPKSVECSGEAGRRAQTGCPWTSRSSRLRSATSSRSCAAYSKRRSRAGVPHLLLDVRSEILKWNGSTWVSCYVSPPFKARAWRVTQTIESASPNSAPCGNAYYTVRSEGGIDLNGDGSIDRRTWITIQQYSNANWYHWFPVAPTSTGGGGGGGC